MAAPANLSQDALSIETLINRQYAYPDRLPNGRYKLTQKLRDEALAVQSPRELVRFAERALLLLADHHAITGASLADSWAVVPSYGDLWIERRGGDFVIEQVRRDSPAARAGIRAGDRIVAIGGVPVAEAVNAFWSDLGTTGDIARDGFAARVLAAGRRDRPRQLGISSRSGALRVLTLTNLYGEQGSRPPLRADHVGSTAVVKINDSLGDSATIAAFDEAMQSVKGKRTVIIDLTDTPSGGNTSVARGIMGWFVNRTRPYQRHSLPAEQRETGIARQWVEEVLPRPGKHFRGRVVVRVGRWTGSMGEGLAIGLHAQGACVEGSKMAGLLGAIYDLRLGGSDFVVKLPSERLYAVDGTPREHFAPKLAGLC